MSLEGIEMYIQLEFESAHDNDGVGKLFHIPTAS